MYNITQDSLTVHKWHQHTSIFVKCKNIHLHSKEFRRVWPMYISVNMEPWAYTISELHFASICEFNLVGQHYKDVQTVARYQFTHMLAIAFAGLAWKGINFEDKNLEPKMLRILLPKKTLLRVVRIQCFIALFCNTSLYHPQSRGLLSNSLSILFANS